MADKMIPMDREYREKQYPNGYLASLVKSERGLSVAALICGAVLALIGLGILALEVKTMVGRNMNLADGDISVIIIIAIVALIFLLPGILLIRTGVRRMKMGEEAWVKKFADRSDYPVSAIREFADQAMEDESMQLEFGATGIKGILTREYICITCVMKIADITGAYLVETSYNINANGKMKKAYNNNIAIFSNHKTLMLIVAKEDTVRRILEMLTQRNPSIDTAGGRRLSESEYSKMEKEVLKK